MTKQRKESNEEKQEEKSIEQELKESLMRVQAEYANFRRRTQEEKNSIREESIRSFATDLLSVLDNFQLALQVSENEKTQFHKGVELIYGQIITVLENYGVRRIQEEKFNPRLHEAIMTVTCDKPKGTIIEELQPGYILKDSVLRTAKVKVSGGKEE